MIIIEALREYLKGCPQLAGNRLNVDYLSEKESAYSIEPVPSDPIVKRYADGSTVRQYLFVLASRFAFGPDIRQQIENLGFYEQFAEWVETQNILGKLPALGDGKEAQKVEVITSGYAFIPDVDAARYQVQCRLKYFQKSN